MTIKDDQIITYLIVLVGAIIVMYFLWRWIFSIERQLKNQKAIITLLLMMAERDGSTDVTKKIKEEIDK